MDCDLFSLGLDVLCSGLTWMMNQVVEYSFDSDEKLCALFDALKVTYWRSSLSVVQDVYRIGTLLELIRELAFTFANDGKRVRVCDAMTYSAYQFVRPFLYILKSDCPLKTWALLGYWSFLQKLQLMWIRHFHLKHFDRVLFIYVGLCTRTHGRRNILRYAISTFRYPSNAGAHGLGRVYREGHLH